MKPASRQWMHSSATAMAWRCRACDTPIAIVKAVALAATSDSQYVQASRDTLVNGAYPLTRMTYAFVNQPPGQPVPALVKEFLRFVYSDEGQRVVSESRGFLPLT